MSTQQDPTKEEMNEIEALEHEILAYLNGELQVQNVFELVRATMAIQENVRMMRRRGWIDESIATERQEKINAQYRSYYASIKARSRSNFNS